MFPIRLLLIGALICAALTGQVSAHHEDLQPKIQALAAGSLKDRARTVEALLKTGDSRIIPVLQHLAAGSLYVRKSDGLVVLTHKTGASYDATAPLTGEVTAGLAKRALKKIKANNSLRRRIKKGLSLFALSSPEEDERLAAAQTLLTSKDISILPLLETRLEAEQDEEIRTALLEAKAAMTLQSDASDAEKTAAISILEEMGGRQAMSLLSQVEPLLSKAVKEQVLAAKGRLESERQLWELLQNGWYGLSLGSVLLLASIGLAITFGVMGVINMAHGEMVMIGAYTTYTVQTVIQSVAPGLLEFSLLFALPLAFLAAGSVGFAMERGVIRFLYGRPLETLLATWGISLFLQQAVRTIFGPTNQEVINPSWMSGAIELGGLSLTLNRIWILLFAIAVFAALFLLIKRSHMGLQMRAVTQNRQMASSMGIRTPWVDAFTFALGSGIAGIAGVALSQIGNVSPNLGQTYIIDSFMVVVFGGVGNLWGTLIGALSLGIANKFMEPLAGAVLAKILVLAFIILFIQKRPSGLFALKGRAAQS